MWIPLYSKKPTSLHATLINNCVAFPPLILTSNFNNIRDRKSRLASQKQKNKLKGMTLQMSSLTAFNWNSSNKISNITVKFVTFQPPTPAEITAW